MKQHDHASVIQELARAIGAAASGDMETAFAICRDISESGARAMAQPSLPGMPAAAPVLNADASRRAAAKRLFEFWQARCGHGQARLTPERAQKIMTRLREGYSEAEIKKAIEGAAHNAYTSPEGKTYDDIELICRNGSKLEDFMARGIKATGDVIPDVTEVVTSGGIEEKIAILRRTMATLKQQGRDIEYKQAAEELGKLLTTRAATRAA